MINIPAWLSPRRRLTTQLCLTVSEIIPHEALITSPSAILIAVLINVLFGPPVDFVVTCSCHHGSWWASRGDGAVGRWGWIWGTDLIHAPSREHEEAIQCLSHCAERVDTEGRELSQESNWQKFLLTCTLFVDLDTRWDQTGTSGRW